MSAPLEGAVVLRRRLESLDKACLAATRAPWASFAPTWRLRCNGPLDEATLARALAWLVARYPWCGARVEGPEWVVRAGPTFQPAVAVVDLRGLSPEAQDAREAALASRCLDPACEPPLRLTWVRRADEEATLAFQQHHALADGRAFLGLLGDFVACLAAAERGAPASPLAPGTVRREDEAGSVAARGLARVAAFVEGALHSLGELVRASLSPVAPLASNLPTDYSGADRTHHLEVPLARVQAWRAHQARLGLSLNELLSGALVVALHRWSTARGVAGGTHTLLSPVDVRGPGMEASFANHLGSLQGRWRVGAGDSPVSLARRLHGAWGPSLARRLPWKRVLFDRLLMLAAPLPTLRRALLDERRLLTNYSFSNLVALRVPGVDADGRWRTARCTVARVLITTPCTPPQAANTTVLRYGEALCFNFNWKAPALDEPAVRALAAEFSTALDALEEDLRESPPA